MKVDISLNKDNQKVQNLLNMIANLSNSERYGTLTVKMENGVPCKCELVKFVANVFVYPCPSPFICD